MLEIRPFDRSDADYQAFADVANAIWPDSVHAPQSLRSNDDNRDPQCKHGRFVGSLSGRVVAIASFDQRPGMYHPRKFNTYLYLRPDCEALEHRRALFDHVMRALEDFDPIMVRAVANENEVQAVRFLEAQGFQETMRFWELRVDVNAFDFTPFSGVLDEVKRNRFEIKTMSELESEPGFRDRFFELWSELRLDVPRVDAPTPVSRDGFDKRFFGNPHLLPDANFFALKDGRLLGYSGLWRSDGAYLETGLTAVSREARRNHLALAMKLRGLEYAKAVGSPEVRTGNESNNRGMLFINERLGFVKQPALISYAKVLQDE
jgi:mycothiol synthase